MNRWPERITRHARVLPVAAACLAAVVIAGCAHQPPPEAQGAPGFFAGLRDGFFMLFSLVASLFADVRIYAFPNSGGWYDLGYFLGAASFLGGGICGTTPRRAARNGAAE